MPPTETPPIATGPSRLQDVFAITLLTLLVGGIGLVAQKTYTSIQFVVQGYEASPHILAGFIPWVAGAFAGALFVLFVSWRVARLVYRSQSYALWTSLVLGIYASIWFLLLYVLLPLILKFAPIPDWASFAVGLLLGIAMAFINAAFVLSAILAMFTSIFRWRKSPTVSRTGVLGPFIFGVLGLALLVYASGALVYPAKTFNLQSLCYGVMSRSERSRCLASSFTMSESGPFDSMKIAFSSPRDFRKIGGKFVFVARPGSFTDFASQTLYVDGEPVTSGMGDLVSGPVDAGNGRIAYVVSSGPHDGRTSSLYIDGELILTDKSIALIDLPGTFAYVVYGNERSYASENGQVVAEGEDETRAYAQQKWPLQLERHKEIYATVEQDKEAKEIVYTAGRYKLVHKQDGLYLNGQLLAPGLAPSRPSLIDGQVIFSASGANAERGIDTYIFAERDLISDEVRERIAQ